MDPTRDESAEQVLWHAFRAGDEEAYTRLYHNHIRALYRYGMSLVPASESFVLDCIQDVFTELWIKRERVTTPASVRHYLLRALKNRILHLLERKEKPFQRFQEMDPEELWAEPSEVEQREELAHARTREERLELLIARLPPRQQEALRLRFVENLDYGRIGELLEISKQSAQNLVFRAVEKLRGWISVVSVLFLLFF